MTPPLPRPRMLSLAAVLLMSCLGCRDTLLEARPRPPSGGARFVGTLVCEVEVRARTSRCEVLKETPAGGGPALTIIRDAQMMVETGADSYTPADSTYRMQVRLRNTSRQVLGSPDGVTVSGIKAFLPTHPMGYHGRPPGDTAKPYGSLAPPMANANQSARARNPDGRMDFTGDDQPYWSYDEKLAPYEASGWREWAFTLHPDVSYFYYAVSIFAAVPGEAQVPTSIPPSWRVPARYQDRANQSSCDFGGGPVCVIDGIDVVFKPDASQIERQAALDLVGGVVEGGMRIIATYYVKIPRDTTLARLRDAVTRLNSLPQVRWAAPHDVSGLSIQYLRPVDGSEWRNWEIRDSAASNSSRTWALEAVSAPQAWGCEIGTTSQKIAVLDTDFHGTPELQGRIIDGSTTGVGVGALNSSADTLDHGTRVVSIIAAPGNDSVGMTGVLWRSSVRAYESAVLTSQGAVLRNADGHPTIQFEQVVANLEAAASAGASVINMSVGVDWNVYARGKGWIGSGHTYDPATEISSARLQQLYAYRRGVYVRAREAMDTILARGRNPLVIMSAGNNGTSVSWEGLKLLADSLPDSFLVVAAAADAGSGRLRPMSTVVGGVAYGTNHGAQVQISAPGQDVWMLNRNGQVGSSGTSFAAPYVTGVAGLLLSFDPRLEQQAGTLKQLILEGARRGGRRVRNGSGPDSVPVLHAYNSLRAAAERPGAPLCGNRVLLMLDTMIVQRGTTMERVVVPGSGFNSGTEFFHGGRWMRKSGGATFSFSVQANQWISTMASPPTGHTLGDHTRFRRLTSHDGDTTFYGSAAQSSESTDPIRIFRKVGAGPGQLVGEIDERPVRSGTLCGLRSETSCWINEVGYEETAGPSLAYPSRGDSLLIFVARNYVRTTADGGEYHCGMLDVTSLTCQKATQERGVIHTRVYKMSLSTGGSRVIWTVPDTTVQAVAAHESGGEIATWARYTRIIAKLTPAVQLGRWTGTRPVEVVTCRQDYRNAADGSLALRGLEDPNCSGLAIYAP